MSHIGITVMLSGVGYLKVPSNLGDTSKRVNNNGKLEMVHGSKAFYVNQHLELHQKLVIFIFFLII